MEWLIIFAAATITCILNGITCGLAGDHWIKEHEETGDPRFYKKAWQWYPIANGHFGAAAIGMLMCVIVHSNMTH